MRILAYGGYSEMSALSSFFQDFLAEDGLLPRLHHSGKAWRKSVWLKPGHLKTALTISFQHHTL